MRLRRGSIALAAPVAVALVLVAGAAATPANHVRRASAPKTSACKHRVKPRAKCVPATKAAKRAKKKAKKARGGERGTTAPKIPTFDKRFGCGAALPLSYLDSVYATNNWSDSVTRRGKPRNSTYEQDGLRGVSTCSYTVPSATPKADGGELTIVYGTGAPSYYQEDYASAKSGRKACKAAAAKNPTASGVCGPVPVPSFGSTAYESGSYIAVLKGKVFVSFEAGQSVTGGQYNVGKALPSSMLETVARYVLARLPRHP